MYNNKLLIKIKNAILEDEYEYCFDRNYCNDENWKYNNGSVTREEAYKKLEQWVETATLEDMEREYGEIYSEESFNK